MESSPRLLAVPQLPELVEGAAPQSGWCNYNQLPVRTVECGSSIFLFSLFGISGFMVLWLIFLHSTRRQYIFQCQLCSRSWCHGTNSVFSVPRPEVLHSPEESPLWNVPQWALLQQPWGPQVGVNIEWTKLSTHNPHLLYFKHVQHINKCLFCSVTDVSGVG